jgi:hypothetical protein
MIDTSQRIGGVSAAAAAIWRQGGMHRKERKREKVQKVEGRKKNGRQVQKQLVVLLQQQQRFKEISVDLFKEQHRSRSWCSPAPLPICTPFNYNCPSFTANAAR